MSNYNNTEAGYLRRRLMIPIKYNAPDVPYDVDLLTWTVEGEGWNRKFNANYPYDLEPIYTGFVSDYIPVVVGEYEAYRVVIPGYYPVIVTYDRDFNPIDRLDATINPYVYTLDNHVAYIRFLSNNTVQKDQADQSAPAYLLSYFKRIR